MKKIFAMFCLVVLSGCVRLGEYNNLGFRDVIVDFDSFEVTPVQDKDYKLVREEEITEEFVKAGEKHAAYVDDTVYYLKIYNVRYYEKPVLKANKSGMLKGVGVPVEVFDDVPYESIGTVTIAKKEYNVIPATGKDVLLVDKKGKINEHIGIRYDEDVNRINLLEYRFRVYPKDLRIETKYDTKKEISAPFYGIEIIYKGKTDSGYRLAFRDYMGTGKEAFQYVDFTQDYEFVDFNNLKLKIISVSPEKLEYVVVK